MVPVALRSMIISKAIGNWSAVLAIFLRVLLFGDLGFQRVGATFTHNGNSYTVFARLRALLSDGEGLKYALDIMGHGGLRPCIRCKNVLKKGSDLAWRSDEGFVEIGCSDSSKFVLSELANLDQEVAAVMAAYKAREAGTMSNTRFKKIETAHGIHANPRGLMFCIRLRMSFSVLTVLHEDWMHGMAQDGCLTHAFNRLIEASSSKMEGFGLNDVESFLKSVSRFPAFRDGKGNCLWRLFRSNSGTDSFRMRGTASDQLTLYILLRYFCSQCWFLKQRQRA